MRMCTQAVIVADAEAANEVLGNGEGLSKALEPDLSDKLLSHRPGHRTMFSADTNSPYWRLIRKGSAPAFKAENIKCGPALLPRQQPGWRLSCCIMQSSLGQGCSNITLCHDAAAFICRLCLLTLFSGSAAQPVPEDL
jgi:hypothetical protein